MFEDIVTLEDRAVQLVLRQVDTGELALALKGVPEQVRDKITGNLSERAAENLIEEVELLGPVRLRQVEEAQQAHHPRRSARSRSRARSWSGEGATMSSSTERRGCCGATAAGGRPSGSAARAELRAAALDPPRRRRRAGRRRHRARCSTGCAERTRTAARAQGYAVGWAEGRREAEAAEQAAAAGREPRQQPTSERREAEHARRRGRARGRRRAAPAPVDDDLRAPVEAQAADLALGAHRGAASARARGARTPAATRVARALAAAARRARSYARPARTRTVAATPADALREGGVAVVRRPDARRAPTPSSRPTTTSSTSGSPPRWTRVREVLLMSHAHRRAARRAARDGRSRPRAARPRRRAARPAPARHRRRRRGRRPGRGATAAPARCSPRSPPAARAGLVCLPLGRTSGLRVGDAGAPHRRAAADRRRRGPARPRPRRPRPARSTAAPRSTRLARVVGREPRPGRPQPARGSTTRSASASARSTRSCPAAAASASASWPAPASASRACCR